MGHTKLNCLNILSLQETSKKNTSPGGRARQKLKILKRDRFRCVHCGCSDNLTIAHIKPPKRNRNRNAGSFKLNDCKTLCVECHILYDGH